MAWMGGEFGGEWTYVYIYMAESFHCSSETVTTLLISYIPIQKKKLKNYPSTNISLVISKKINMNLWKSCILDK